MRKIHKKKHVVSKRALSVSNRRRVKKVDNTRDIDIILSEEKLIQELLGVSNEKLNQLFEGAVQLLHQHRYDEAGQAFKFLIQVNPFVPDFWIGQGLIHQVSEDYRAAISDYLVAQTMDPSRAESYVHAIECCLEMRDIKQAEAILRQGLSYAKRYPSREESRVIFSQLKLFQNLIEDEKKVKK
jgi:tetratricopeptide (TPR) repeat protein